MNDLVQSLQEGIRKQLVLSKFDILGIIPVPSRGDQVTRLRTLQEIIEEQDEHDDGEVLEYLVQIRLKKTEISPALSTSSEPFEEIPSLKSSQEHVYQTNGKLNLPFLLKNAEILADAGDYPLARNILKTIIQSGEYTGMAWLRMGKCFEAEGKWDAAIASLEESVAYTPNLEGYEKLMSLLIMRNRDLEAAEIAERALHLNDTTTPDRFQLHKTAGNCWLRSNKSEEAERHFKKALEIDPTADEVRSNLGVLYLRLQRTGEAKRNFQDAIASNPRNAMALAGLGSCALVEGDKASAHDFFAQSLRLDLNNMPVLYQLIRCAYDLKQYAIAATVLEDYIIANPNQINLMYSLAGLQFHQGRFGHAKLTILKVLKLQPDHSGAGEMLSLIERYGGTNI